MTLFDSVGFAIEDFSALRYVHDRIKGIGAFHGAGLCSPIRTSRAISTECYCELPPDMTNRLSFPLPTDDDIRELTEFRRASCIAPPNSPARSVRPRAASPKCCEPTRPDKVITGMGGHGVAAIYDSGRAGPDDPVPLRAGCASHPGAGQDRAPLDRAGQGASLRA